MAVGIPKKLVAGDDWAISWSSPAWPDQADRAVELVFGSGAVRLSAPGRPLMTGPIGGNTTWLFGFSSAQTGELKAGAYQWYVLVSDGAPPAVSRQTAELGITAVAANPRGAEAIEPRSIKRLTLDAAKVTLFKLVSGETASVTFQGHQYTLWDLEKLRDLIRELELEVEIEDPGAAKRKLVYTRFRKI